MFFVKIAVFAVTFTIVGIGIWGVTQLETKFDSTWFLPKDSYVAKWSRASNQYFPNDGEVVTVYVKEVNYSTDLAKIDQMMQQLEHEKLIVSSVDGWYSTFKEYTKKNFGLDTSGRKL